MSAENNLPFWASILLFVGAMYPAMNGLVVVGGTMLVASGAIAIIFSESFAVTNEKLASHLPFNKLLTKILGKTSSRTTKLWGIGVVIVGISWVFVFDN